MIYFVVVFVIVIVVVVVVVVVIVAAAVVAVVLLGFILSSLSVHLAGIWFLRYNVYTWQYHHYSLHELTDCALRFICILYKHTHIQHKQSTKVLAMIIKTFTQMSNFVYALYGFLSFSCFFLLLSNSFISISISISIEMDIYFNIRPLNELIQVFFTSAIDSYRHYSRRVKNCTLDDMVNHTHKLLQMKTVDSQFAMLNCLSNVFFIRNLINYEPHTTKWKMIYQHDIETNANYVNEW